MPNHPDPPSWADGHPDPPFWAVPQKNNGATSITYNRGTHRQLSYSSLNSSPLRSTTTPRTTSAEQSSFQSSKPSVRSSISSLPSAEKSYLQSSGFSPPDIFPNFPHFLELTESVKLDEALSRFETDISPWKDPHNWLRVEAVDLDNILSKLSEKRGQTQEYAEAAFHDMMVYTVRRIAHALLDSMDLWKGYSAP